MHTLANAHHSMTARCVVRLVLSGNKGELVLMLGTVGSGQSSLMCGLLGEAEKTKGRLALGGEIGYVPQSAFIINATLRLVEEGEEGAGDDALTPHCMEGYQLLRSVQLASSAHTNTIHANNAEKYKHHLLCCCEVKIQTRTRPTSAAQPHSLFTFLKKLATEGCSFFTFAS